MKYTYRHTRYAAYIGFITQAVVNSYAPLLFVTFSDSFGMSLEDLSILITINFGVQLLTDILSARLVDKIGYRNACTIAHTSAALGLVLYGILPFVIEPFAGLLIADVFCALGGGLDEVVTSPIIEALPSDRKSSEMSVLHSFYCWGQVLVVVVSTLFFTIVGIEHWRIMAFIWAIIPAYDVYLFLKVPILELNEGKKSVPIKAMLKNKLFWLFMIIMLCAGASEFTMSQWVSLFAEKGIGVDKAFGDLLGTCLFAILMGTARIIYAIKGKKINLQRFILASGILCVISYMVAVFSTVPVISLAGCALCGLSVALMWPGTYSMAAEKFASGGTAMFSILALAGDIGCTSGPTLAGMIGDSTGNIGDGLLVAAIFPLMLVICVSILGKRVYRGRK